MLDFTIVGILADVKVPHYSSTYACTIIFLSSRFTR